MLLLWKKHVCNEHKKSVFKLDKDTVVKKEIMDEKSLFLNISTVEKGEQTQTITLDL
jgi:hypothetical protein